MKQRGRKSTAKLAVAPTPIDNRPLPPETLTKAEKTRWTRLVASRDANFFDEAALPLLAEFCRMQTSVERVAKQLNDFDDGWLSTDEGVKRFKSLESIRDQKQARLVQYATKMRLTQQARYVPDKATNRPKASAPAKVWQREN